MRETILLIEDDADLMENTADYLELKRYKVLKAKDGFAGLELLQNHEIDLVICDIILPAMDGYKVLKTVLDNPKTAGIPFIFLTSKSLGRDFRKGMNSGADDYITKPFDFQDLERSIKARLNKRKIIMNNIVGKISVSDSSINNHKDLLFFTVNKKPKIIKISEIRLILAQNQYSKIFVKNNETLLLKTSLKKWEDILPASLFLRIHRSIIVNIDYIESISRWENQKAKVTIKDIDGEFTISRSYANIFKKNL